MRNVPSYIHVVACTQEFGIRFLLFSYYISFPCYSCLFPSWELVRVIPDSGREARGWYMVGVYAHALGEYCPIWCGSIILHKYVYFRSLSLQAVLLRLQFTRISRLQIEFHPGSGISQLLVQDPWTVQS